MADSNGRSGAHEVPVQVIFWRPELGVRPEVIVDRDGDRVDFRTATRIWEAMTREADINDEWATFLANHPGPSQWRELQDVVRWLDAVNMELPRPQTLLDTPVLRDDTAPGRDRDLTVGVICLAEPIIENTVMFAGFDQADVERRVAERILSFIDGAQRDLGAGGGFRPDLDDPVQVTRWLDRASTELTQVGFWIHQMVLHADSASADVATVGVDAVAPSAGPVEATVWLAAAFLDGQEPEDEPTFVAGATHEAMEHDLAFLLYRTLLDVRGDRRVNDFLADHTSPAAWSDPTVVGDFLDAFYSASPGPAFNDQQVQVRVPAGVDTLHVASLVVDNPFDARLMADTDPAALRQMLVDELADQLGKQPPLQEGRVFLAEHGRPHGPVETQAWLDAFETEIGSPAFVIDRVRLPAGLNAPPVTDAAVRVATPAAPQPAQPAGQTVRVDDLWAAVIESESLGDEDPQVWVGTMDTVSRAAVRLLAEQIDPNQFSGYQAEQRADFLAAHPVNMDIPDSVEAWIDAFRQEFREPAVFLRQVYDAAKEQNLPPVPAGVEPPNVGPEQVRVRLTPTQETAAPPETTRIDPPLSSREEMVVGVIRWGDDPSQVDTMVGGTAEQMRHDAAMRMWATMQSSPLDTTDVVDPTGLDADAINLWLAGIVGPDHEPVLTVHEHVSADRLTHAMGQAINQAVLNIVEPVTAEAPSRRPVPAQEPGTVMIETARAGDWEVLDGGGIPDRLIAAFPPLPRSEDHLDADGTQFGDTWGGAIQDWMDRCRDLTDDAAHLPELRARLDRLQDLHNQLVQHLGDHRLPREPRPDDYRVARPDYLGQIDDGQYREDHLHWEHDFRRTAIDTEQMLARLVGTTDPGHRIDGVRSADAMVEVAEQHIDMLYDLIKPGPGGTASLAESALSATDRMRLYQTIRAGAAPIRVPNPDDTGADLYSGYATTAYQHLSAGVYDATLADDSGLLKLVVGRSPVTGCSGASGAYPLNQATIYLLSDIEHLRTQAIGHAADPDLTVTVGLTVSRTNRIQTDFPMSQLAGDTPPGMNL